MKQVAYNFELVCLGGSPHATVVVGGVKVFFNVLLSGPVSFIDELEPPHGRHSFFISSPLPIVPVVLNRTGSEPKFGTDFISNAIGNCKLCDTIVILFKCWSCWSATNRSFEVDLKLSAILSIFRLSAILDLLPRVSMFKKFFEFPFSSKAVKSCWLLFSNWFRHCVW